MAAVDVTGVGKQKPPSLVKVGREALKVWLLKAEDYVSFAVVDGGLWRATGTWIRKLVLASLKTWLREARWRPPPAGAVEALQFEDMVMGWGTELPGLVPDMMMVGWARWKTTTIDREWSMSGVWEKAVQILRMRR